MLRAMLWGVSAAIMLFAAVFAAATDTGGERLYAAYLEIRETLSPSGASPVRPLDAREGSRLAETVRTLTADRDKLLARIANLEQSVDGVTGSVARMERLARAATPPPVVAPTPAPAAEAPTAALPAPSAATPEPEDVTASINPPSAASVFPPVPMPVAAPNSVPLPPPQGPGSIVNKTEFGLDLGSATSVEALRTAWSAALRRHGSLLEGLRPVVQMRERPRPAAMEFRLIAGPLANAGAAARLCASMTAAGAICAPALFEGQRLAVR